MQQRSGESRSRGEVAGASLIFVLAAGCQCFSPVGEGGDGGLDASSPDGGADAGQCAVSADCTNTTALLVCSGAAPAATCLDHHCVVECTAGRACTITGGFGTPCLVCTGEPSRCGGCPRARVCDLTVTSGSCAGRFADGAVFRVNASTGTACGGAIAPLDGGAVAGTWWDVWSTSLGRIDELGGFCSISNLYTGVPRSLVSCPACTFIAEGCE